MKYKMLAILGVCSMLLGYGMVKSARVMHVECERTESSFLPVCRVGEYLFGIPNGPARTVGEIMQLANYGKEKRQFFLMQRLNEHKVAPVNLNKVRADRPADQEPVASLNRLAAFFQAPNDQKIEVKLANEAGSLPLGFLFLSVGAVLIWISRTGFPKSPKASRPYRT